MTLKDSTEHNQDCLMTYYDACDDSIESHNGEIGLGRESIRSNRYDPTTWTKECKTG